MFQIAGPYTFKVFVREETGAGNYHEGGGEVHELEAIMRFGFRQLNLGYMCGARFE